MLEKFDEYKDAERDRTPEESTPENHFLDKSVFKDLPDILNDVCRVFSDEIEKNLVFLSSLTVLSGCMPNVYGVYDRDKIGANFFLFVVAPASSGKGCLKWSKTLAQSIHRTKREQYKQLEKAYKEADDKDKVYPKQLLHYIPANTSASAFIKAFQNNGGCGTLFCTEADTLSGALKQDWGNFSDVLRCAFHHEPISQLRKNNDDCNEIEKPYLSILLSGTPNQVHNLIPNPENGLLSRFGFFTFQSKPTMKDVFADDSTDLDKHFEHLQNKVERLYNYLNDASQPIRFIFTLEQKADFLKTFENGHTEFHLTLGLESIASIRRLGVIMFRLCMILSVLRLNVNDEYPGIIKCTDQDYQTAKSILETLKRHTTKIFISIQKGGHKSKDLSPEKYKIYKALPDGEFKRKEAVEICKKMGLSDRTLDRLLKGEYFEKTGYGIFKKVN